MYPVLFRFPDALPLLGGEPITSFGVMMFLAFLTSGLLMRSELARTGYDPDKAWDLLFMAVVGGVIGAKLYFVVLNWPQLMDQGVSFVFSRGGMVWYGGFLLATALVVWEVKRSRLPLGHVADLAAPILALAYGIGRIGCFLVGDDWGRPTDLPIGIAFPEGSPPTRVDIIERSFGIQVDPALVAEYGQIVPVHPTQLYEVAMSALIFVLLWRIRKHGHQRGWLFMLWLALAGAERFVVEFFRAKDDRFVGVFTVAQVLSVGLIVVGIWGMLHLRRSGTKRRDAVPAGA